MNKPKRHQANGRPSQEWVSSDSDSLEMEDAQETGIEGILSGLKMHRRNLSLGDNLAKDSYSAPASSKLGRNHSHAENAKDDDTTDSGNSLKWHDWICQRAGFSFENFEAGEITYRNPRIHEKENQLNKQFAIIESSSELLDNSNEEMLDRIQYLELQLATALRLLRSKSEKYAAEYFLISWCLGTGASHHITPDISNLQDSKPYIGSDSVMVGGGETLPIHRTGLRYQGQSYSDYPPEGPL